MGDTRPSNSPLHSRGSSLLDNPILVGGPPRSGTTFIARSLGQHPQVVTAIDNHVHECEALYSYRHRIGLVARLRDRRNELRPQAIRAQLLDGLLHNGSLHVSASPKTEGMRRIPPPSQRTDGEAVSIQDLSLERHELPLGQLPSDWRLCLKSPEISYVITELAALLPGAAFILVYRPLEEIAYSMFRLGNQVKRFPVFHARWRLESVPPPGLPDEWTPLWHDADDLQRCVLHGASYLRALALSLALLDKRRWFLYAHPLLRRQPEIVLNRIAVFLRLRTCDWAAVRAGVRREEPDLPVSFTSRAKAAAAAIHAQRWSAELDAMAGDDPRP